MLVARGDAGKTRMDAAHAAVTSQKNSRRIHAKIHQLRKFGSHLIRSAGDEHGKLNVISFDKTIEAGPGQSQIGFGLEIEAHDFKSLNMKLLVQLHKKWRLIVAIRAPASTYRQDHNLAPKSRVFAGYHFA